MSTVAVQKSVFYATGTARKAPVNYKLVLVPRVTNASATGGQITVQDEVAADFSPNGRFVTDDPGLISALRDHPDHGVQFLEEGMEPGRVLPTEEDFRSQVVDAATSLDQQRLLELVDEERASHERPELIALAERALAGLGAELHDVSSGDPE